MVDLSPQEAGRAIQTLLDCGLRPRVPVNALDFADREKRQQWIDEKNMLVFQMVDENDLRRNVDIFVSNPVPFDEMWERSQIVEIDGVAIRFASIDHMIELKRRAGRPQDLIDLEQLERLKEANDGNE